MNTYKNKATGGTITVNGIIHGKNWELVKPKDVKPKKAVKKDKDNE